MFDDPCIMAKLRGGLEGQAENQRLSFRHGRGPLFKMTHNQLAK